jgi:hypothetical protein
VKTGGIQLSCHSPTGFPPGSPGSTHATDTRASPLPVCHFSRAPTSRLLVDSQSR